MKFKSRFLTFTTFALLAGAVSAQVAPTKAVLESGKLSIASSLSYAPFEYVDEKGAPAGLDIELAQASANVLGVKLDIVTMPFASQIPALASGRIKVAWATFSVKEERLRQVDFVVFLQAGTVLSTLPAKAAQFKSADDLCGQTIAVQSGTAADFTADKLSARCTGAGRKAISKSIYPDQKDIIQAVLTGRAIGRLDDSTASGYYQTSSGGKLVVAPGQYDVLPLGIAVPKGDKETADMMRRALQRLMDDGTYARILDKYGVSLARVTAATVITSMDQLQK